MPDHPLHERPEDLSTGTRDMHRALASLIEELEAVDWYAQRIEACGDEQLARVLAHNRDEEKEHACMALEWIRRRDPTFDQMLRRFLFQTRPQADPPSAGAHGNGHEATLGIGSLRAPREEAS